MTGTATFPEWFDAASGAVAGETLDVADAFAIAVCRIEESARLRARDPVRALSNGGSEGSRRAAKAMFGQLGYTPAQTRIMQRILAGSPCWPGMIRLYLAGDDLSPSQRQYVRRQIRQFRLCCVDR